MNWGQGIVAAFILFVAFVGVIVFKAMNQDISLVSQNYYQEELAFENVIQASKNFDTLIQKPIIDISDSKVNIYFQNKIDSASILFYKPNNKKSDFKLSVNSQYVVADLSSKPKGLWRFKTVFYKNGLKYFKEGKIEI